MNRRFKHEIGIDCQGFFKGSPGSAFIWKKKKQGRLISLTFSQNYRFQIAFNGTLPLTEKVTALDTTHGRYMSKQAIGYSIQPMFGIERVNFFNRFNIFYGCDFGPSFTYGRSGYIYYTYHYTSGGSTYYNTNYYYTNTSGLYYYNDQAGESKKIGLSVAPFIGVKYRISERFSASMESAIFLTYFYSVTKLYAQPYYSNTNSLNPIPNLTTVAAKNTVSGVEFSPRYLRFLTFNYHFN
jgi:hypothetical protein